MDFVLYIGGAAVCHAVSQHFSLTKNKIESAKYPSSEIKISIPCDVDAKNVLLFCDLSDNSNQRLIEALFAIESLKQNGAKAVTLIAPFLLYSRMDKPFKDNNSNTAHAVLKMLHAVELDKLVTCDLHNQNLINYNDIEIINILPTQIIPKQVIVNQNYTIIAPDNGAINRSKNLANKYNLPFVSLAKKRDANNIVKINCAESVDIAGKNCLIVDDMLASGATLRAAIECLKNNGAASISAYVTHNLAGMYGVDLNSIFGQIDHFYCTNSISGVEHLEHEKYSVLNLDASIIKSLKNNKLIGG